ncbi:MAG: M42 family metallopeptidase [Candidatus Bathyarchaeota archaeon]|nr:MAG: M42 family metallopeptidase [Candidatus Bathyarchaeota archaeon]
MRFVDTLEKLSNAYGVVGREAEVRKTLRTMMKPYVDKMSIDKLGDLIGVKYASKKKAPKVMLAAHMDEIGLIVKNITKDGFLQFAKLGGIDDRVLIAQRVLVHTEKGRRPGIVGSKPPHIMKEDERKKTIEADSLFIDVGVSNREEARETGVKVGDVVSFDIRFDKITPDLVIGKAFDDRVGCSLLLEVLKQLEDFDCTTYFVGTVQEEVGLRGACVSAFQICPDVAIALDVTVAGDVPGVKEVQAPIKMKKGPAIGIMDSGLITHPKVLSMLVDAAEKADIPYQLETGMSGSTDAARIALTREGVPCGVVSVPTRYIHSPSSMLSLGDVEKAAKLATLAVREAARVF